MLRYFFHDLFVVHAAAATALAGQSILEGNARDGARPVFCNTLWALSLSYSDVCGASRMASLVAPLRSAGFSSMHGAQAPRTREVPFVLSEARAVLWAVGVVGSARAKPEVLYVS